ncbi:MAG: hypothetical protein JO202_18435 [Ktedonobacteraceae bacterium]|nr:hypothetical protein [Ktedonobacteraceae bacterium]
MSSMSAGLPRAASPLQAGVCYQVLCQVQASYSAFYPAWYSAHYVGGLHAGV